MLVSESLYPQPPGSIVHVTCSSAQWIECGLIFCLGRAQRKWPENDCVWHLSVYVSCSQKATDFCFLFVRLSNHSRFTSTPNFYTARLRLLRSISLKTWSEIE